ncbi:hypothetical protein RB195_011672 [Necator americanus]|uniref:C2H2-type domain-containing protein n=1 Tax=Necator americanus TaxID=51031 RepID=A0ABR1D3P2_NECAM
MRVIVDVCQNTDLVELLSFAKSRQMCIVGFPDNPELEFLRSSEVPIAVNWRTPGKLARCPMFYDTRKRDYQRSKQSRRFACSSSSASEDDHYLASGSGSVTPPSTRWKKNRNVRSPKWKKRRQDNNVPKTKCKKCSTLVASSPILALFTHANIHSNFVRYKCGGCNFQHRTYQKVRMHIETVHRGDPTIKHHDQMNEYERMQMRQLAHECFPTYIVSPAVFSNDISKIKNNTSSNITKAHCGSKEMSVPHPPNYTYRDNNYLKKVESDFPVHSEDVGCRNTTTEEIYAYDSDCIILE